MPPGRPSILFGGLVPAAFARAATRGDGWVAPLMGLPLLEQGAAAVSEQWQAAGRGGKPRIATGRYVSLGPDGARHASEYLAHYYGREQAHVPLADTPTTSGQLLEELDRLQGVGVTDVLLFPCTADRRQLDLITESVHDRLQSGAGVSAVVRS